jgi:hypothetical protein
MVYISFFCLPESYKLFLQFRYSQRNNDENFSFQWVLISRNFPSSKCAEKLPMLYAPSLESESWVRYPVERRASADLEEGNSPYGNLPVSAFLFFTGVDSFWFDRGSSRVEKSGGTYQQKYEICCLNKAAREGIRTTKAVMKLQRFAKGCLRTKKLKE